MLISTIASLCELESCGLGISCQGEMGTTDLQKEDEVDLEREAETKVVWSQKDGESNFGDSFPWRLYAPPATGLDKILL